MKKNYQQETVFQIWRQFSSGYRNLMDEYNRTLEEKKRRKISPLNPVPRTVLREFPKNDLLEKETADEAWAYIKSLSATKLVVLTNELERLLETNYSYITIRNRICDFRHQIRKYDESHRKK